MKTTVGGKRLRTVIVLVACLLAQMIGFRVVSAAPVVKSLDPLDGAIDVPVNVLVAVEYDQAVTEGGGIGDVAVLEGGTTPVDVSAWCQDGEAFLWISPDQNLEYATTYVVVVPPTAVVDAVAGEPVAAPLSFSFTTVPDLTGPTFYPYPFVRVDKMTLQFYDQETGMDVDAAPPDAEDFIVTVAGDPVAVTSVEAEENGGFLDFILTLQEGVTSDVPDEDILLNYVPGDHKVLDNAGNPAAGFAGQEVTNETPDDLVPPEFVFAIVPEGVPGRVTVVFDEVVSGDPGDDLTITVDGDPIGIDSYVYSSRSLQLTVAQEIDHESAVMVSYNGAGALQDASENPLGEFGPAPVANYGVDYTRPVATASPDYFAPTTEPVSVEFSGLDFGGLNDTTLYAWVSGNSAGFFGDLSDEQADSFVATFDDYMDPADDTVYDVDISRQYELDELNAIDIPLASAQFTVSPDAPPANSAGEFNFSDVLYTVSEDAGTATITVERTGGSTGAVTVDYATGVDLDDTAADGVDYTAASGTLNFANGETEKTFDITIIDNGDVDGERTLSLELSNATGDSALGDLTTATLQIQDDEAPQSGIVGFELSSGSVSEGDTASVKVVRTGGSEGEVTADYSVSGGTADPDDPNADFTLDAGILTFGNGVTSQTIFIPTTDDDDQEPPETIILSLSGDAVGEKDTFTLTISDNDIPVAWTDGHADHIYFDGDTIGFQIAGVGLPDSTGVRVALGVLTQAGFDTSLPALTGMSREGVSYYYVDSLVSNGTVAVTGTINNPGGNTLPATLLAAQLYVNAPITGWTEMGQVVPLIADGDQIGGLIGPSIPAGTVSVTPSLKQLNLFNTGEEVTFTAALPIGGTGSITFAPGLDIINYSEQLAALQNSITMLGAADVMSGEVTYVLGINTGALSFLASKGATVTVTGLPAGFLNPEITTDGSGEASGLTVTGSTLSFDVNHFSNYTVTGERAPTWPNGAKLTFTDVTTEGFTFSWPAATAATSVTGYKLYRGPDEMTTVGSDTLSYQMSGLSAGTVFTINVEAVDANLKTSSLLSGTITTAASGGGGGDNGGGGQTNPPPAPPPVIQGSTADVSNSATKTTSTSSSGTTSVTVTIPESAVTAALSNQGVDQVVVKTNSTETQQTVGLSGSSFSEMASNQANLVIETPGATLTIPPQVVNVPALSDTLGVPADQIEVKVSVQEVSAEEAANLTSKIMILDENLQPIGSVMQFSIQATGGGKSVEIDSFGDSQVTGEIPFPAEAAQGRDVMKFCVYRFNEATQSWEPVRSHVDPVSGKVVFYTDHFSNYAVMALEKTFADIAGHWAQKDIELMASRWVVKGDTATTFAPERSISRAEFAALLVRALGLSEAGPSGKFADVPAGLWFSGSVEAAAKAGIVDGTGARLFEPDRTITREEMASMVSRAMKAAGHEVTVTDLEQAGLLAPFADGAAIQTWARSAFAAAVKAGIVRGVTPDSAAPSALATRAEAATMVRRLMEKAGLL